MTAHTGAGLVRRATVEEIVGHRNRALLLYETAYEAIAAADAAVKAARQEAMLAHPGINNYNYAQAEEIKAFARAVQLPNRDQYLRTARRLLDIDVWAYVIQITDLERLMDHEAKEKLRGQMKYVPERVDRETGALITGEEVEKGLPPVTVENIMATLEQFMTDSGTIFRRGIANAFSKLDRRFRSHDGFKIGSRVILTYAFSADSGYLQYGRIRDTLIDIERVFSVLDGRPESAFRSALDAVDMDRRSSRAYGPRQSEVETEYFRIRGFKNGNAHLWFLRDDLVEKVNKLLADYYGETIGDGQTKEADPLKEIKTTPAKRYGFYPTPDETAGKVLERLPLWRRIDEPRLTILEPSAGTGNLARRCIVKPREVNPDDYDWRRQDVEKHNREYRLDNQVDCVEIQPDLARSLEAEGIYRKVYACDFHALTPSTTGLYDRVVMNPPFDRERDIDHVMRALGFLKPDGILVAIMSAGTEFRETRKAIAFRKLMKEMNARFEDLPAGSFAESGTYCNTMVMTVRKDGGDPGHNAGWHRFE